MSVKNITEEVQELRNFKANYDKDLIFIIHRLSIILGATAHLLYTYEDHFSERDKATFQWIRESTENVLYFDKPLAKMP